MSLLQLLVRNGAASPRRRDCSDWEAKNGTRMLHHATARRADEPTHRPRIAGGPRPGRMRTGMHEEPVVQVRDVPLPDAGVPGQPVVESVQLRTERPVGEGHRPTSRSDRRRRRRPVQSTATFGLLLATFDASAKRTGNNRQLAFL